jgi:hAT family C-terminal dimerisation region
VEATGGADAVDVELSRYWVEENEEKLDVIDWWKVNEVRYPILAMVARRNLAVQATSAESERDFSAAGLVTSK